MTACPQKALALLASVLFALSAIASELPVMRGLGGDFEANSSDGDKVRLSDFHDNVVLLTFGFTNCPDVCPITLGYMNLVHSKLTPSQQEKAKFMFITVDPEYDTPDHLNKYLAEFNPGFIGINGGNDKQTRTIADLFNVVYQRTEGVEILTKLNRRALDKGDDDTTRMFNHSISIFMLDTKGRVRNVIYTGTPSDKVASQIAQLQEVTKEVAEKAASGNEAVRIENAWIRTVPASSSVTALYAQVTNLTNDYLHLENISCPALASKTEFHNTTIVDGVAKMQPLEDLDIEQGSTFAFRPLGPHVMLMDLKQTTQAGLEVTCVLNIEGHTSVSFSAMVENSRAAAKAHSNH